MYCIDNVYDKNIFFLIGFCTPQFLHCIWAALVDTRVCTVSIMFMTKIFFSRLGSVLHNFLFETEQSARG